MKDNIPDIISAASDYAILFNPFQQPVEYWLLFPAILFSSISQWKVRQKRAYVSRPSSTSSSSQLLQNASTRHLTFIHDFPDCGDWGFFLDLLDGFRNRRGHSHVGEWTMHNAQRPSPICQDGLN